MKTTNIFIKDNNTVIPIHFITSDHHVGHVNIARFAERPFDNSESTDEMDESLIDTWNSVVTPEDNVLVLGDVALGKIDVSLAKWKRFSGTKFLVPGNHDRISSVESTPRQERFRPVYEDAGFIILPETISVFIEHTSFPDGVLEILASHYPYSGDSQGKDRHANLRPEDTGKLLIHGHTHSHQAVDPEKYPRQFHVGVDSHDSVPVAASVIAEWAVTNA